MLKKIRNLFKRPKTYSLPLAVEQLDSLIDTYETLLFALSTISKEAQLTQADVKYAETAMFNLCSFRDELKIRVNTQKELAKWTKKTLHVNTLKQ